MNLIAGPFRSNGLIITFRFGTRRRALTHSLILPVYPGQGWQTHDPKETAKVLRETADWLEKQE